jgi:hypothetical protein
MKKQETTMVPKEIIMSKIYLIRGLKVMLDKDLAVLYSVTTGNLNKAVRRNLKRFPDDFMFRLTNQEFDDLIFQNGISSWGGIRKLPFAFTEQGVAILSGVLHSDRAIMVNVQIIRVFSKLRKLLETHTEILRKLEQSKQQHEAQSNRKLIGFKREDGP